MTFYHFVNCIALSYAPFHMTYKVSTGNIAVRLTTILMIRRCDKGLFL